MARKRQSSAVGPSFSRTCLSLLEASVRASQMTECAGGGVYSGACSIGLSDEQPAPNTAGTISQVRRRAILIPVSVNLILMLLSSLSSI